MSESRAKPIGPFELGGRGGTVVLERCDEVYGGVASSISAPIRYDPPLGRALASGRLLGPLYAWLIHHTGRSDQFFDDHKGTFAFTFKVKIRRGDDAFRYLLRIFDHCASLRWHFARVPEPSETFDSRYFRYPFDAELRATELDSITQQLELAADEITRGSPTWIEEFAKAVDAEQVIYGFDGATRRFYTRGFDDVAAYESRKKFVTSRFSRGAELQAIVDEGW